MSTYQERANALVREFGDSNEIERLEAGLLPEEELDRIVSDVIFEPVLALDLPIRKRWKKEIIQAKAVRKGKASPGDEVRFEMLEDADALTGEQWVRLKQVRAAMPEAVVKPFVVIAVCGEYKQRAAAVSVEVGLGDRVRRLDLYLDPYGEGDRDPAKEALGLQG
jgi:hypothetical protein